MQNLEGLRGAAGILERSGAYRRVEERPGRPGEAKRAPESNSERHGRLRGGAAGRTGLLKVQVLKKRSLKTVL